MRFLSLSFITLAVSLQRKKEKNEKKKEIKNNKKKNKQKKDTKKPTTIGETKKTVRKHIHAKIQQSFAFAKRQNEKRKKKKAAMEKGRKKSSPFVSTLSYCAIHIHFGVRWFSEKKKKKKKVCLQIIHAANFFLLRNVHAQVANSERNYKFRDA